MQANQKYRNSALLQRCFFCLLLFHLNVKLVKASCALLLALSLCQKHNQSSPYTIEAHAVFQYEVNRQLLTMYTQMKSEPAVFSWKRQPLPKHVEKKCSWPSCGVVRFVTHENTYVHRLARTTVIGKRAFWLFLSLLLLSSSCNWHGALFWTIGTENTSRAFVEKMKREVIIWIYIFGWYLTLSLLFVL